MLQLGVKRVVMGHGPLGNALQVGAHSSPGQHYFLRRCTCRACSDGQSIPCFICRLLSDDTFHIVPSVIVMLTIVHSFHGLLEVLTAIVLICTRIMNHRVQGMTWE